MDLAGDIAGAAGRAGRDFLFRFHIQGPQQQEEKHGVDAPPARHPALGGTKTLISHNPGDVTAVQ